MKIKFNMSFSDQTINDVDGIIITDD